MLKSQSVTDHNMRFVKNSNEGNLVRGRVGATMCVC